MIAAIDPGLKGGAAVLGDVGDVHVIPMPVDDAHINTHELAMWLKDQGVDTVVLEDPIAMPGLASTAMLTTGINWGRVYERLQVHGFSIVRVKPNAWVKASGQPKLKRPEAKKWRIQRCRELFPDIRLKASDDGIADALLMAWLYRGGKI